MRKLSSDQVTSITPQLKTGTSNYGYQISQDATESGTTITDGTTTKTVVPRDANHRRQHSEKFRRQYNQACSLSQEREGQGSPGCHDVSYLVKARIGSYRRHEENTTPQPDGKDASRSRPQFDSKGVADRPRPGLNSACGATL
ncbi:hypothetical protein K3495_g9598 [Podosphaera aphanis]|nr:hypothetical protein K3495_g9598 [Podosphaera aphanis]